MRQVVDLVGLWGYRLDPQRQGREEKWLTKVKDLPREQILVPSCIQARHVVENRTYEGEYWYLRIIFVPPDWAGNKTSLVFDGVCYDYFNSGGIYRGVRLELRPPIHVKDFFVKPTTTGEVNVLMTFETCLKSGKDKRNYFPFFLDAVVEERPARRNRSPCCTYARASGHTLWNMPRCHAKLGMAEL